jgi:undecaprenyl-diphosphatase
LLNLDSQIAVWFHAHLTATVATLLHLMSTPGGAMWVGATLALTTCALVWTRRWSVLTKIMLAGPCGMLLGELVKLLVHRQRPYTAGPFVDWSGYSFPSGHTLGATLLYGTFVLLVLPRLGRLLWRIIALTATALLILCVAFSRVALGAHYLTDVTAAMIFGSLWLVFCFRLVEALRPRLCPLVERSGSPSFPSASPDLASSSSS